MRWLILSLLFVATTINYFDRGILGVILPEIRKELTISTQAYGVIVFAFQIAYGVGSLIGGKLLDRYGTRLGYAASAAVWSPCLASGRRPTSLPAARRQRNGFLQISGP